MKILAKVRGETTEHEISNEVSALVHQSGIKVTAPTAYNISSETTIKCMAEMSDKAWVHISTGPLFQHFFKMLFGDDAYIPKTIEELNDEGKDIIHGSGLIIQLVESRFDSTKEVFIETPENHLHPKQQQMIMSVIEAIRKIPLGG